MKEPRGKKNIKFLSAIILFILISSFVFSYPAIENVVMNPPNPGFGDPFTLEVTYCGKIYNDNDIAIAVSTSNDFQNAQISGNGQYFILTNRGVDVHYDSANGGEELGYTIRPSNGTLSQNCTDCGGDSQSHESTYTVDLHMPQAEAFPGCNVTDLHLLIGMKYPNLAESDWTNMSAADCHTYVSPQWTIPVLEPQFSVHKRAEGVLQDPGDLILFSIDYEYANGRLVITDSMPVPSSGQFTLVSVGPESMWNNSPPIGTTSPPGGTMQWTLPDRTGVPGKAAGTVWFLMEMSQDINDGEIIHNEATGSMGSLPDETSVIDAVVGQAVVNLTKSQSVDTIDTGGTITYYLEYDINGSKLVAYEPFDDVASNTYNAGTSPPPDWQFSPSSTTGDWWVHDECNTGDSTITGSSGVGDYPGLLYNGTGGVDFCTGVIISDVMIEADYEGADSLIFIRNNNKPGTPESIAYSVGLSVDNMFGNTSSSGESAIGFQRCVGDGANPCIWPTEAAGGIAAPQVIVETNRWYRVKVEALSDFHFRAKAWAKGSPEPAGWDIDWTDPSPPANGACADDTWYTGIAQQGGDSGWTRDNYNNFMIYEPRVSVSTHLYDTVPNNVTYVGYQGETSPIGTSPWVEWNLGDLSNQGGTYTWWGEVGGCDPITNRSTINGTGIVAVDSNEVVLEVICEDIVSITKTANVSEAMVGDTITWTITYSNDGISTVDPYVIWDTVPGIMTYLGCLGGACGQSGGIVTWDLGTLAPGGSGSVTWWGTIDSLPANPLFEYREIFARNNKRWISLLRPDYAMISEGKGAN